jgi:hypothetical protein
VVVVVAAVDSIPNGTLKKQVILVSPPAGLAPAMKRSADEVKDKDDLGG